MSDVPRETLHVCRNCGKFEPEVEFYVETSTGRRKSRCKRCWYLKTRADHVKRVAAEKRKLVEPIIVNHAAASFLRLPRPPVWIEP